MNNAKRRILIVGPAWLGDMVMAQPLFTILKQQHPDCSIDIIAPSWTRPLLAHMPEIDKTIDIPLTHGELGLTTRFGLGKTLRDNGYHQAYVLPNSWKSALVPWFARILKRTGYIGEARYGLLNDTRRFDRKQLPMMAQRFAALAMKQGDSLPKPLPHPALQVDEAARAETLAVFKLKTDKPILALCPGAEYGPAKKWPVSYFAKIAKVRGQQGWQIWLLGSKADKAEAIQIIEQAGEHCLDMTGRTSISQAIDLLSLASQVVTNDSGLMHIAAALGRPLVALFGSTDPAFTPPLSESAKVLRLGLECSPCLKRECPLGHMRCLVDLKPESVLRVLDGLNT